MKSPDHERQARSRKARAEAGGKQIAIMRPPVAAAQEGAQTRLSDAERQRRRRKRGRAIGIVLRDPAAIAALDAGIKLHGGVLAAIGAALRMAYPAGRQPPGGGIAESGARWYSGIFGNGV